jgi:uncharacterized membrane protein
MKSAKNFFSEREKEEIVDAIAKAELNTSGEIRVHVEDSCKENVFKRGVTVFTKLKMNKTELKNGVLFYFSVKNKKFAIVADKGINDVVKPDFWNEIKEQMQTDFLSQNFTTGLCKAIKTTGIQLAEYFPLAADDKNELSNEISTN